MYLIRNDSGQYEEAATLTEAQGFAEHVRWCTNCRATFIGPEGTKFAGRPAVLPRVTFDHPAVTGGYRYLTVVCLTCVPITWARLATFHEAEAAKRAV